MEPKHDLTQHRELNPRPPVDVSMIQGWGADLDRKNRPGVPMEHMPPRLPLAGRAPVQQRAHVEVLVSPERPHLTPLFGTGAPPRGLSGMLRRLAYKLTESDVRHWLLLFAADRVNVIEGIGDDLARGHLPNLPGEMGIRAAWEHNRPAVVKKAVLATAVAGAAYYLLRRRNGARR